MPLLLETAVAPTSAQFRRDVLNGLRAGWKSLPCKYFYDERGSRIFDEICRLPEYYPTRTESAIMQEQGAEMGRALGPGVVLVEYGSGSSLKTRILLSHLENAAAYVPLDISGEHLRRSAQNLAAQFPALPVLPLCADYTRPFHLPEIAGAPKAVYFPGSTIGNFAPDEAALFLRGIAEVVGPGGAVLIGVDLAKSAAILEPAYNDSQGVTAAFNLNLLERINRELDGDFDLELWRHFAIWKPAQSRIEMHLLSQHDQKVCIGGETLFFRRGETILTEYSHKWTLPAFSRLAASAGLGVEQVWTDEKQWFSVQLLRAMS